MRFLYSIVLYMLTPFLVLRLWWKGRKLPAYRQRIAERFCWDSATPATCDIWIHAVSLGEVIAATPLINELLSHQWRLLITTTTPTGSERVRLQFGDKVQHRYLPYDLPTVVRRFYRRYQPRLGIIMETELWPNLIAAATQANIPLVLVNARLSDRSCEAYKKISWLIKPSLNQFCKILAQSALDAERFVALGANPDRVELGGNLKFDINTSLVDQQKYLRLQSLWGEARVVLMLASTHENEEQQILSQLKHLQIAIPDILVLIAPRHPERFQTVFRQAEQLGLQVVFQSQAENISTQTEVIVIDAMGEMLGFYSRSHFAFVGGSLVPVGGHNVLEPIALGVPVFSGREVHNFKSVIRDLEAAHAIELVNDAHDLVHKVIAVHKDPIRRSELVSRASGVLEANKGALARYVSTLESLLDK